MLKFIQKWFDRKVHESWNRASSTSLIKDDTWSNSAKLASSTAVRRNLDRDPTLQFKMHRAENGWVVEMFGYDEKADRSYSRLTLISDGADFDTELSHIVTMQALRGNS
jgi:hypothetical protein